MSLFLGEQGEKNLQEDENIVIKFIKMGTDKEHVWELTREHRAILEGNKDPPGRPF